MACFTHVVDIYDDIQLILLMHLLFFRQLCQPYAYNTTI